MRSLSVRRNDSPGVQFSRMEATTDHLEKRQKLFQCWCDTVHTSVQRICQSPDRSWFSGNSNQITLVNQDRVWVVWMVSWTPLIPNKVFFCICWVKEHTKSRKYLRSMNTSNSIHSYSYLTHKKTDALNAFPVYIIIQTQSYIFKSRETHVDIIQRRNKQIILVYTALLQSHPTYEYFGSYRNFLGITHVPVLYTVMNKTLNITSYRQDDQFLLLRTQPDVRQPIHTYTAITTDHIAYQ
jgi:hypothetical protein